MNMYTIGLVLLLVQTTYCATSPEEGNNFEGDMILTSYQRRMIENNDMNKRGAIIGHRWPGGVVPYTFHRSFFFDEQGKNVIRGAMKEWSDNTCVKFKKRSDERGYIQFQKPRKLGCASYVGYRRRRQVIKLSAGCLYHGIVAHEIGHALGFFHEQSRPDRDNYVKIIWKNIARKYRHNFQKYGNINSLGEKYDYGSIMHYGKKAFSRNGMDTIKTLNGAAIGQRARLSRGDIKQMNKMYNCKER
uniref:Metalloendopeptidase n=1 Tax=Ceriantheomorphe brasiliensis TaxID=1048506 RepID=A0A7G7WYQ8_9CNID|nr:toxin candidate TRINITY_DN13064_c0_g1_i3 [Ceriantheomorphe brasiliensis]